ncbi:MAG: peptide chain release factor N(5)-glutamine methyltransferase [Rubrobacter sp.]|nr:peptide chain release factor N(5)-glutamine methyltransferase [Rubrobacter sp.]
MRTGAVSARQAARDAASRMEKAGVPEPVASAEVLLSELLDVRRGDLTFREEPFTADQAKRYEAWVQRRIRREPVQRILGHAYFRNLKLDLDESTLIPRPDTESVVNVALELIDTRPEPPVVLDIGTGSGAIAIAIAQERPACEVHATDISEEALDVARRNARKNGTTVEFHQSDVVAGLDGLRGKVEMLVSNPPYVGRDEKERLTPEVREWDPHTALFSEGDDLLFYRRIFAEAPPLLTHEADVVLEVGDGQAEAVLELGRETGFVPLGIRPDLAGTPRSALLRWRR